MGKITEEQKQLIEKYTCERLTKDPKNKDLRHSFSCEKGMLLVEYFRRRAWEEDEQSQTAFYLIKTPSGEPALFFSLKCGALFSRIDENQLRAQKEKLKQLLEKAEPESRDDIFQLIEYLRIHKELGGLEK